MSNIGFPEYKEAALPSLFEKCQQASLTTFHMPLWTCDNETDFSLTLSYGELVDRAPFARFSVSELRRYPESVIKGATPATSPMRSLMRNDGYFYVRETTTVMIDRQHSLGDFSSIVYIFAKLNLDNGSTIYSPSAANDESKSIYRTPETLLDVMYRLNDVFINRKHRFLNSPISRQVRRARNAPPEYREYIVIPREDARYKDAVSRTEMMKSLNTLHAVRGHDREEHLRQYKDGRIVVVSGSKVRDHVRGQGSLFQVKDYKIK